MRIILKKISFCNSQSPLFTKSLLNDLKFEWEVKGSMTKLKTSSHSLLNKNTFQERRKPGRLYSRDTSTCKNGQKSMKNWIGTFLRQLNFDWINTGRYITDDYLRVHLKKCFYTSRLLWFRHILHLFIADM